MAAWQVHRLTEQYRMPAVVCQLVSKLFYHSILTTPDFVGKAKRAAEAMPLVWLGCSSAESTAVGSTSTVNLAQVTASCMAAAALRERHRSASICVLTFYKGHQID